MGPVRQIPEPILVTLSVTSFRRRKVPDAVTTFPEEIYLYEGARRVLEKDTLILKCSKFSGDGILSGLPLLRFHSEGS